MLELWLDFMLQPPIFFRYSRFHGLLGRYDVPKPYFDALNVRRVTLNNQVLSPWLAEFERVFPKNNQQKGKPTIPFCIAKKKSSNNLWIWISDGSCPLFGDLYIETSTEKKKTCYSSRFPNLDIASRSSFLAAIGTGASGEPQLFNPWHLLSLKGFRTR